MSCAESETESTSGSSISSGMGGEDLKQVLMDGYTCLGSRPYHENPAQVPDPGKGPVIIWDFDTAPFKAEQAQLVVKSLLDECHHQIRLEGWHKPLQKPTILFCYTRKIRLFDYPGREQAITQIRRRIPADKAYVRTRTTEQKDWMEPFEAREELRSVMRFKIREFQNQAEPGPLMMIVSGDGSTIKWHMNVSVAAAWRTFFVIPYDRLSDVWTATQQETHSYCWDFHAGLVGINPTWWVPLTEEALAYISPPQVFYAVQPYGQTMVSPASSSQDWTHCGYQKSLFGNQEPVVQLQPPPLPVPFYQNYDNSYWEHPQGLVDPAQLTIPAYLPAPMMMAGYSGSPPLAQVFCYSPPVAASSWPVFNYSPPMVSQAPPQHSGWQNHQPYQPSMFGHEKTRQ